MMEMIKETTTDDGDDGRARRRRARVRETIARVAVVARCVDRGRSVGRSVVARHHSFVD